MSKRTQRRAMLIALAAALAVAVLYDRLSVAGADAESSGDASMVDAYLAQAAVTEKSERLVNQADDWNRLLEDAQARWASVRERMIEAPSAEIASARLTQIIERIMRDMDLSLTVSDALPVRRPLEDEPLHVIGLSVSFSALNPDVVMRLVDRLENLPEVRTNLARLQISGPGRRLRAGVEVTIELRALAWIPQGDA